MRSIFCMPSDELPASKANGRYLEREEGKMRSIFCMPSDELPASEANGRYMLQEGKEKRG